jgi:dTDP-4-amino-4,6-dideoxy-D-galactose acyltransferase
MRGYLARVRFRMMDQPTQRDAPRYGSGSGMRPGPCEFLEWDSRFFGLRIARLTEPRLTANSVASARRWCRANQIDCLYFLADTDDAETVMLAQINAFQLVDIRLTLERSLSGGIEPAPAVRPFQPAHAAPLRAIARVSHRDSRFYYDAHFARQQCDALYEAWIERSFGGWADAVLVAEWDDAPAGYISCHLAPPGMGSIGLFAVAPEYQRRGLGRQLVAAALEYFRQNGMQQATVVTQGRNVVSQRVYQRCAFMTRSAQLWYHCWFKRDLPA